MYILDIFFKRRKFIELFEQTWKAIGDKLSLARGTEDETEAQLELFYFVSVVYSSVFHTALAAGMSASSAHYLARLQSKKSKVDQTIVMAVEKMFSTPEGKKQDEYVALTNAKIKPIVAALQGVAPAQGDGELQASLDELRQSVEDVGFTADELFAPRD